MRLQVVVIVNLKCQASRPRSFMHALIDFDAKKDKTVLRDHVCEAILQKRSVLLQLEQHVLQQLSQQTFLPGLQ